ncbi:MAG TPA: hypothetical protein VNE38_01990 [Ktedonobacteraceae bacterium]|nr:hypothetical protein [Ktedonobacteraceae bacterium]
MMFALLHTSSIFMGVNVLLPAAQRLDSVGKTPSGKARMVAKNNTPPT